MDNNRRMLAKIGTLSALLLLSFFPATAIFGQSNPDALSGDTIREKDNHGFRELEAKIRRAAAKALPAVVAVETPKRKGEVRKPAQWHGQPVHFEPHFASGVIIRPDGLILSQWHVSHQAGLAVWREPGDVVTVVMHNGERRKARLLGAEPVRDISLLEMVEPGEYPHVPFAAEESLTPGDWTIKLGHPHGYRAGRTPVARLGRVVHLGNAIDVSTDCLISPGDSGGPLIDLEGRLVGVIESGSPIRDEKLAERGVNPHGYIGIRTISKLLPMMICPPEESYGSVRLDELEEVQNRSRKIADEFLSESKLDVLATDEWTQGQQTRTAFAPVMETFATSIVEVLQGNHRVAFGTVVDEDGWVLTKASEISREPRCRLGDGFTVKAKVVATIAEFDLAVLKIDTEGRLSAVTWDKVESRPIGSVLCAPDCRGKPIGIGIVSVAARRLEGPFRKVVQPDNGAKGRSDLVPSEHMSFRHDNFPAVFEHDIPLALDECGGPTVNLDGAATGITIARVGPHGCMAIPGATVQSLIRKLKTEVLNPTTPQE